MLKRKTVLLTGASSGFGEAIARSLVAEGANVVGVARRADRLKALSMDLMGKPGTFLPIVLDVTAKGAGKVAVEKAIEEYGRLDALINNAGVMLHGPVLNGSLEDYSTMLDVNVKAVMDFTIQALPYLLKTAKRERAATDIVMMSSVMGREPKSHKGGYNATKFAINAFADALRLEIIGNFVRICKLEPGMADTEIAYKVNDSQERAAGLRMRDEIELLTAQDVADCVLFILNQPHHVNIQELLVRPVQQL